MNRSNEFRVFRHTSDKLCCIALKRFDSKIEVQNDSFYAAAFPPGRLVLGYVNALNEETKQGLLLILVCMV